MARLASKAKAGFYPTPDSVIDLLTTKLEIEEGARLLNPCCGKGITLSQIGVGAVTYGIELDHGRAQKVRTRLHKVIWGDALTEVRISPERFKLLYLNPPYDTALAADSKETGTGIFYGVCSHHAGPGSIAHGPEDGNVSGRGR